LSKYNEYELLMVHLQVWNVSSGKNDKDPNRPKKAQSAYFIFMGDYRNHCKMTGESNTSNVSIIKLFHLQIIKL